LTEIPDAAVRAALVEHARLLYDRPDPMVLSDEALFRRVLEAALPHLFPSAPDLAAVPHAYVSTACFHGECGACRDTCKYCDGPCSHGCHPASARGLPEPWVDQARGIARELLRHALSASPAPPELVRRIEGDPALFWLRGEAKPPGQWRDPKMTEDTAHE